MQPLNLGDNVARYSPPSSKLLPFGGAFLIAVAIGIAPGRAMATPATSAANIPYSGISPGGVDMATGELILVMRPDLAIDGPFPVVFRRYYASMLVREGLASGHLGPNWLGTYDWSLAVGGTFVNVVTNRGQLIQFQPSEPGYALVTPTDEKYKLAFVGGSWMFTHPGLRRIFLFDGTSHLLTQILDEHGNSLDLSYSSGRLSQVSDGSGRTLTFTYDPTGLLALVGDGTRSVAYSYTGGVLTGFTDAAGHPWTYSYIPPDPCVGLLAGQTEPLGNIPLTQMYDPFCRVMSQTDALGGMAMYSYDAPSGNVFTDPLGNPWTYLHDTQNRLSILTDPAANPTSFAYDPLGRPSSVMRPMGDMTSIAYDPTSGYPSMVTYADGTADSWVYGSHSIGGATLFDLSTASYPGGSTESYARDALGDLTDFTDRSGAHWLATYNTRGQVLTAANPTSGVTTFTYDPLGRLATRMDNAGNTSHFTFDALSRLTEIAWPDASHRDFAHDNLDDLTEITDERGKAWTYAYDEDGRPMTATDPLGDATGLVYDLLDRMTQVVDPLGHATTYAYDPAGRLMSITDRSGRTTGYQHDTAGRLTGIVDPAGGTTTYSYDADSRVPAVQDPLTHSAGFGYDMMDRITHMTDPVGTEFDYAYDVMGRLNTATSPLGHSQTFGYDPRGLLTSFFNAASETDMPRTPLGEVSAITDPDRHDWPRAHDPQGRITSEADPLARTTTYEYDALSRPIHVGRPDGTVQQVAYDPAGRVTGESYTDGTSFTYSYDDANRLTAATGATFAYDAAGRMTSSNGFTMAYDNEGRITSETLAPGKVVSYAYESRGLPSQVMDWLGGTTSFTYDAAERLTGITRPNGTTATYEYDAANRLINAVEKQPGPAGTPIASISITRDALGQPTSINRRQPLMPGETAPSSTPLSYDAASQLNGVSHDALGRTTGDASRAFQWDGASRLKHYAAGADSPSFTFDAFGSVRTWTQGNRAVQQGWNYWRGVPDMDDTQVNLPAPKTSYYVRAPSGLLLYSVDGSTGARRFYHYDEAGNTSFLTNDLGSVVTGYAYTPFGGVTAVGETDDNPFTWNAAAGAMQLGSGSGLFDTGGGVYDAVTMRGISGNTTQSGSIQNFPSPVPVSQDPGPVNSPGSYERILKWTDPARQRVTREISGTILHEVGHNVSLNHYGSNGGTQPEPPSHISTMNYNYQLGGSIPIGPPGGGASDPSTWPVGPTFTVNDDMPVPLPPWRRSQAASLIRGNNGSGMAEVWGNDAVISLADPGTYGDGLSETWESSQIRVDCDCDGTVRTSDPWEMAESGNLPSPRPPHNPWEFLRPPLTRPPEVKLIMISAAEGGGTPKPKDETNYHPWRPAVTPSEPGPFELFDDVFYSSRPFQRPCLWCPQ